MSCPVHYKNHFGVLRRAEHPHLYLNSQCSCLSLAALIDSSYAHFHGECVRDGMWDAGDDGSRGIITFTRSMMVTS